MGRRWLRLLIGGLAGLILGVMLLAGAAWRTWTTGPAVEATSPATTMIRVIPGSTLHGVSRDLAEQDLLTSPRIFRLGARLAGRDRDLKVGRFAIPAGSSPREILVILTEGQPVPVVIQLTEGLEAAAMAELLADSLGLESRMILAAADSLVRLAADTLMAEAGEARLATTIAGAVPASRGPLHWCEGFLAPDTYHFAEGTTAASVARSLVALQRARLDSARQVAHPVAASLTAHELLALASIIEAEAQRADERETIAAVYHNRLQLGMRLEADPTVAFWLGKRGQRLLYRDLERDSPYNTYRRGGLPVAPISSPGAAAIMAAARPDTSCHALFFVADGSGGHVFSRTMAEHQQAVQEYRKLMKTRRR